MKKSLLSILFVSLFMIASPALAQPYGGTIFIDPDIITNSDPSTLSSVVYTGRGMRIVFDRRVNNWVQINAYLFKVTWNDGITSEAQVNPEFGSMDAAKVEADQYGLAIGKLPKCLRVDVDAIWIHKGVQPFGGGNKSILIHTGQSELYEADGILEETLVHEATHTSLDAAHALSQGWKAAQAADTTFISTYAKDNPTSEDVAESFLTWMAVQHRADRISLIDSNKISNAIPNRIAYFNKQHFDMNPIVITNTGFAVDKNVFLSVYPCPADDRITVGFENVNVLERRLAIMNILGETVYEKTVFPGETKSTIEVGHFLSGIYFVVLGEQRKKVVIN